MIKSRSVEIGVNRCYYFEVLREWDKNNYANPSKIGEYSVGNWLQLFTPKAMIGLIIRDFVIGTYFRDYYTDITGNLTRDEYRILTC